MVGRLVRIRHDHVAMTRGILPHDVPSARTAAPDSAAASEGKARRDAKPDPRPDAKPPRPRHAARHARTSGPSAAQQTSLSIRSAERRRWAGELTQPDVTALVIHGLGGVGKSTLAAQIAARASRLAPERVVTMVSGEVSAASLAAQPAETDLVVLDNFDDNLTSESGLRTVRDPALAALLAGWTGKLLITCRSAFTLPPPDRDRFVFRHLGPLTRSGAAEFAMSLPALRALGDSERDLAWRLTVGHPRAMEYLDALVAAGLRFGDLAARAAATIQARTGQSPALTEPTELSEVVAEITAQAVGQQLFGELFERLSDGGAVHRRARRAGRPPGPHRRMRSRRAAHPAPGPRAHRPPLDGRRTAPPPGRGGPDRAARRRAPPGRRLLARPDRHPPARPAGPDRGRSQPAAGRRPLRPGRDRRARARGRLGPDRVPRDPRP